MIRYYHAMLSLGNILANPFQALLKDLCTFLVFTLCKMIKNKYREKIYMLSTYFHLKKSAFQHELIKQILCLGAPACAWQVFQGHKQTCFYVAG